MRNLSELNPNKPRKISETVYTDAGVRLNPAQRLKESGWFLPMLVALPAAAFILVLLW